MLGTKLLEVKPHISAESLAALVMLSKRTTQVAFLNFYSKKEKKIGHDPANWEGKTVPPVLLVVMDRGRFELNVPGLPHLCSNIFTMGKRSSIYLRGMYSFLFLLLFHNPLIGSSGTLHRILSVEDVELQLNRKDLQSSPVSNHSQWMDVYQQVRKERHPRAHWVVATPCV